MDPVDKALDQIFASPWQVPAFVAVLLLGLAELGYRTGLWLHSKRDEARKSQISGVQGAILGLMGMLLGFSFAMGVGRHDARKDLVLKEANVVGTTYLRADLLPAAHREEVKSLLREYVEVRLRLQSAHAGSGRAHAEIRRSLEIQGVLWNHACKAAAEAPTPITAAFITTLNELIDTDAERLAAFRNRIPGGVWLLLVVVAGFGCFTTGYSSGSEGARSAFTNVVLPVLVATVILLIYDLMHPHSGLVGISQQPLLDLKASVKASPP